MIPTTPRLVRTLVPGLMAGLMACASAPRTFADCNAIADEHTREGCRFTMAQALLDQPQALAEAIASIEQIDSRDLLLLRLAVADPARSGQLCSQVTTAGAIEKCQQVVGRPHLSTSPRAPR